MYLLTVAKLIVRWSNMNRIYSSDGKPINCNHDSERRVPHFTCFLACTFCSLSLLRRFNKEIIRVHIDTIMVSTYLHNWN